MPSRPARTSTSSPRSSRRTGSTVSWSVTVTNRGRNLRPARSALSTRVRAQPPGPQPLPAVVLDHARALRPIEPVEPRITTRVSESPDFINSSDPLCCRPDVLNPARPMQSRHLPCRLRTGRGKCRSLPRCSAFTPPPTEPDTRRLPPPKLNSTIEIRCRPDKQSPDERCPVTSPCQRTTSCLPAVAAKKLWESVFSPARVFNQLCPLRRQIIRNSVERGA